ncbi:MAG: ABC transporter permease subunit [Clostridiales bacterium]|nr:ABC transporter permease subunit [Clostridiales bacterium]
MTVTLYTMMIPGLIYLIINNYIPMVGLQIAFKKFNYSLGMWKSPWTGLSNFTYLFKTKDALNMTINTLLYNIVFLITGTVFAVFIAILLNELRNVRAKKIYQVIFLIPYLISMVIVSYIVFAFLSFDKGFINNSLLKPLGLPAVNWYMQPSYWPYILTGVNLWKVFGYSSIIYYATVIGIDTALYEAAVIDRADAWQRIWHVTLPGLRNTIITLTVLGIGRIFYSDFGLFYQVPQNSGVLANVTQTIDVYVYKGLTQLNDIGRSSAASFYQSVVGFALVLTANFAVSKLDRDSALF